MKLPFVSRAHHDFVVATLERQVASMQAQWDWAAKLNSRPAQVPVTQGEPVRLLSAENEVAPIAKAPAMLGSEVEKVIREQASESGAFDIMLAKHLRAYARTLKTQGKTTDEIIGALVAWTTTESQFQERG